VRTSPPVETGIPHEQQGHQDMTHCMPWEGEAVEAGMLCANQKTGAKGTRKWPGCGLIMLCAGD
jgi:hypothetical protein